jgi:FtsZ-binding cell division protein ZapB
LGGDRSVFPFIILFFIFMNNNANPSNNSPIAPNDKTPRPSVPISVYRELATELEETKFRLESIHQENQVLSQQNQQLREEIEQVIQSHLHLEEVISSLPPVSNINNNVSKKRKQRRKSVPVEPSPLIADVSPADSFSPPPDPSTPTNPLPPPPSPEKIVREVSPRRERQPLSSGERPSEVNMWLLVAGLLLVIFSAFAAGFLIVRPLLNNNNNSK